mmetsp:Transcript_11900/g.25566  ORF Transcript_11900/g.25566 Transcript_11900/m.25566 type:complete len:342 (+) Transcript_11900:55-1080(+)
MKWHHLAQSGDVPEARSSHSITYVPSTSKLYLFGGEHDPRTPISSDVYAYDTASHNWAKVPASGDIPEPRVAHTATYIEESNLLYFYGGRNGKEMGEGAFGDMRTFSPSTGAWVHIQDAKGTPPPARSYHTATSATGTSSVFVFGGCGEAGRLADLYQFDTRSHTWSALPTHDAIRGRGGSCITSSADGRRLYVLAGFCGHELADSFCYDLAAGKWEEAAPLPVARSVFGAAVHSSPAPSGCSGAGCGHGGHIMAFGGEVDPSTQGHEGAGDFSADLFCYDESARNWHKLSVSNDAGSPGPCARGWYAYTSLEGGLLVHGGLDCKNERLGDMFVLNAHEGH